MKYISFRFIMFFLVCVVLFIFVVYMNIIEFLISEIFVISVVYWKYLQWIIIYWTISTACLYLGWRKRKNEGTWTKVDLVKSANVKCLLTTSKLTEAWYMCTVKLHFMQRISFLSHDEGIKEILKLSKCKSSGRHSIVWLLLRM